MSPKKVKQVPSREADFDDNYGDDDDDDDYDDD